MTAAAIITFFATLYGTRVLVRKHREWRKEEDVRRMLRQIGRENSHRV